MPTYWPVSRPAPSACSSRRWPSPATWASRRARRTSCGASASRRHGALQRAVELAGATGERLAWARTRAAGLGELALASGDAEQAVVFAQQATGAFRAIETPLEEARALTLLGEAQTAVGDSAAADAASAQVAALRAKLNGDIRVGHQP